MVNNSYLVTVLIPTYERPDYLRKLISYLIKNFNLEKTKFFVLDGSEREAKINERICQETGIKYKYYGPEISVTDRILSGLETVNTEFVLMLADDDILSPEGLNAGIEFLKENPKYSVAHGEYVYFLKREDGTVTFSPYYSSFSFEQENPLERIFDFLSNYKPIYYALHRTAILKEVFKELSEHVEPKDYHMAELLAAVLPVAKGKVKKLRCIYYARQIGQSIPGNTIYPSQYIFNDKFYLRYSKTKEVIKRYIQAGELPEEMLEKAVDYSFQAYYGSQMTHKTMSALFSTLKTTDYYFPEISLNFKTELIKTLPKAGFVFWGVNDLMSSFYKIFRAIRPDVTEIEIVDSFKEGTFKGHKILKPAAEKLKDKTVIVFVDSNYLEVKEYLNKNNINHFSHNQLVEKEPSEEKIPYYQDISKQAEIMINDYLSS